MRVIGGTAKGQPLKSLPGENTRPTLDRVKESMFNMIQLHIFEAKVLDLFGGSGALGIEALSRGGKFAHFVEEHRGSISVIQENLGKTRLKEKSRILSMDFRRALETLKSEGQSFDLIFLDPPYGKGLEKEALELIAEKELLAPGGLIIIEQDKGESLEVSGEAYIVWKEKKYGNTFVRVLKSPTEA